MAVFEAWFSGGEVGDSHPCPIGIGAALAATGIVPEVRRGTPRPHLAEGLRGGYSPFRRLRISVSRAAMAASAPRPPGW